MTIDQAVQDAMYTAIQGTCGDERRMYEALQMYYRTRSGVYQREAAKYYRRLSPDAQYRVEYLGEMVGTSLAYPC